jgi:putative transposase
MLSPEEFPVWLSNVKTVPTALGIEYLKRVRINPQSRLPQGRAGNVIFGLQSSKMGFTIEGESHTVELPYAQEREFDPETLEYYPQPEMVKINYDDNNGVKRGVRATFDFLVITKDGVFWVELKTAKRMHELAKQMKNRYIHQPDGTWSSPPAEELAKQYGFIFIIITTDQINYFIYHNNDFLKTYYRSNYPPIKKDALNEITNLIKENPGITIKQLLPELEIAEADDVYAAIARKNVYFDFKNHLLSELEQAYLYISEESSRLGKYVVEVSEFPDEKVNLVNLTEGEIILWDEKEWMIINVGTSNVYLRSMHTINDPKTGLEKRLKTDLPHSMFEAYIQEGAIVRGSSHINVEVKDDAYELVKMIEDNDLIDIAIERVKIAKGEIPSDLSDRQKSRIRSRYREGIKKYGEQNATLNVAPLNHKRGNKTKRFDKVMESLILEAIIFYIAKVQPTIEAAHNWLIQLAIQYSYLSWPSKTTFTKKIKAYKNFEERTKSRRGPKAANKFHEFYFYLTREIPRHGNRVWQFGHLDHTELDMVLRDEKTGKSLGKCWLTLLIDAYTRRILVFHISFDKPSYRTNMMVIRECVRKWGRLPETIITDGGKDLNSKYMKTLLGFLFVHTKVRPGGKPHFSGILERAFGIVNTNLIYTFKNNTQMMKKVREVVKSYDPNNNPVWTLPALWAVLYFFFYELLDTTPHASLGNLSPRETYLQSMQEKGKRKNTFLKYDKVLELLTLPTTDKGTATIIPGRGVKINYIYYWCPQMGNGEVEETSVSVKYDPFDIGRAFAQIQGIWCECISEQHYILAGHSYRELQIATERLRQIDRNANIEREITGAKLGEFIKNTRDVEILLQREKDTSIDVIFKFMEKIFLSESERNKQILQNSPTVIAEIPDIPEITAQPPDLIPIETAIASESFTDGRKLKGGFPLI